MLAHVLVLLYGCAYALSVDSDGDGALGIPYYVKASNAYKKFAATVHENVISMSGNIPPLTDPRRHQTIIFNVINTEADIQGNCGHRGYDQDYLIQLNKSAPEAVSEPEKVISDALLLLNSVDNGTENINKLLNRCPLGPDRSCDIFVHEIVQKLPTRYETEVVVLLQAGDAARQYNSQAPLYNYVADNQDALDFVINGKDQLKETVMSLAGLHRTLSYTDRTSC